MKSVKEEERAFIVCMGKAGATITKIVQRTKRPRALRLRRNVQIAKRSGRPLKSTQTNAETGENGQKTFSKRYEKKVQ